MSISRTIFLSTAVAVAFAGSVHAQNCSAGPDGGIDATGNQCNDSDLVAAYATAPAVASSVKTIDQEMDWADQDERDSRGNDVLSRTTVDCGGETSPRNRQRRSVHAGGHED